MAHPIESRCHHTDGIVTVDDHRRKLNQLDLERRTSPLSLNHRTKSLALLNSLPEGLVISKATGTNMYMSSGIIYFICFCCATSCVVAETATSKYSNIPFVRGSLDRFPL
ncbi:hypothetical protein EVAR_53687_1 [Eumeta japonica]|uniref:Uncharacterized protein n=1 Tax=Eumeta variegata TaxID=151549 RepID=A0A4C1YQ58_EUMVA|nr:hypothetical protein EVAR_53687_1 [Eumeta japonica]